MPNPPQSALSLLLLILILPMTLRPLRWVVMAQNDDTCLDMDGNCPQWIDSDKALCTSTDYIAKSCRRSCGVCVHVPKSECGFYRCGWVG